jgi:hypothetical protein
MDNMSMQRNDAHDAAAPMEDLREGRSVTPAPGTRFLHVANGTSTTMTIEAAGISGDWSIWADPLHEGPVPAGLGDRELVDVRMQHLTGPAAGARSARAGSDAALDPVNDLREWRAAIERHHLYDELILWFEHDLFDQLNLIQLLTWIRDHLPAARPVSLICIGSFPGRPDFKGLGELSPDELASLLETRLPIADRQYELARRAWQAFREPTPEALDELRRGDTSPMPYLAPAITRFLQEYPWTTDGLSRSERRLLELADGDGIALWKAFPLMADGERFYHMTGESLAELADTLSRTSPPLLTLTPSAAPEGYDLRDIVTLTDAGQSILSGRQDRIAACGIDRWLGGVHLQNGGRIWRWDDTRQRISGAGFA